MCPAEAGVLPGRATDSQAALMSASIHVHHRPYHLSNSPPSPPLLKPPTSANRWPASGENLPGLATFF